MTETPPKPRRPRAPRRPPAPLTLGDVIGQQVRDELERKRRAAELADMGFRPVGERRTSVEIKQVARWKDAT